MVAVFGLFVVLIAVNELIFPLPLPCKPMVLSLFVQLYVTVPPVVGLVKVTAVVGALLHTDWKAGLGTTVGDGLTVMVNVAVVP